VSFVMKLYHYVGPKGIAERLVNAPCGTAILSPRDVVGWAQASGQKPDADGCVIATFIVDESGVLRIADRRSEHVACAGGGPVRSAGEINFALNGDSVKLAGVSNQSTGYCPEPESWPAVADALSAAGLAAPGGFSFVCVFRLCPSCDSKNLVKEGVFECAVCGRELPSAYNCQSEE
jgi:hypothetical protein